MSRMDDIVQYFVECLLTVKSDKPSELNYTNNKIYNTNRYNNLSFENKYIIHQNINYYLNKRFNNDNLEINFNKFKFEQ
jgi:hypothetical protein